MANAKSTIVTYSSAFEVADVLPFFGQFSGLGETMECGIIIHVGLDGVLVYVFEVLNPQSEKEKVVTCRYK